MATRALSLVTMTENQQNKYITHNQALHLADTWVGGVKSRTNSGPPGSPVPAEGDAYIVDSATGDWSGFSVNDIVVYYKDSAGSDAWIGVSPATGPQVYVEDEDVYVLYDGSDWETVGSVARFINRSDNTDYTLVASDANKVRRFTNTSGITVTVPTSSQSPGAVTYQLGTLLTIRAAGSGGVTVGVSGLTINGTISGNSPNTLLNQHEYATLMNVGTDAWDVL